MKGRIIRVTKLEAAERQFSEAVALFFEERDPVAVHTLAGAAVGLLNDLATHQKIDRPLRDHDRIRDKREWDKMLKEAQNFFKHADRDPAGELQFRTASTPFLLMECALLLLQISARKSRLAELHVFFTYCVATYPRCFHSADWTDEILRVVGESGNPPKAGWLQILRGHRESLGPYPPLRVPRTGTRKPPL